MGGLLPLGIPFLDLNWNEPAEYYGVGWFFLSLPNWIVFLTLIAGVVAAILIPIPKQMVD